MIINLGCIRNTRQHDIEKAIRFSKGSTHSRLPYTQQFNAMWCVALRFAILSSYFSDNNFIATQSTRKKTPEWIKWWSRKWACELLWYTLKMRTNSLRHINQTRIKFVCVRIVAVCLQLVSNSCIRALWNWNFQSLFRWQDSSSSFVFTQLYFFLFEFNS